MREILDLEWWEKLPTLQDLEDLGFNTRNRWDRFQRKYQGLEEWDKQWEVRRLYTAKFSWCLPSRETLETVLNGNGPLLELGAGTGFWGKLLRLLGGDVISTSPYEDESYEMRAGTIAPVENLDAQAAQAKYQERNLLVTWPGYGTNWLTEVAEQMCSGQRLIYIGETAGGCCADDSFFELIEGENDSKFASIADHEIPKFEGIHDRMIIYERA